MMQNEQNHPSDHCRLGRRHFVQAVGAGVVASGLPSLGRGESPSDAPQPENLVAKLHDSLTDTQRESIWFPWDHRDKDGPLRTRVSANWHITKPTVISDFFTADQQEMIEAIFFGLYHPDWHDRIRKQLKDDAGGYGKAQNIALFGEPGSGKFELVVTGRHLTMRCDGDSTEHFAFGGPIFYGHAAQGANEPADHAGNVFWSQAVKANGIYQMLDGAQRKQALLPFEPAEYEIQFQGKDGELPGLAVADMSADQKTEMRSVLDALIEPFRETDRAEVDRCVNAQGGLDTCRLSFYETGDIGEDRVWDNWRLEGPSFVWYFRGSPHVHVWVNIADSHEPRVLT